MHREESIYSLRGVHLFIERSPSIHLRESIYASRGVHLFIERSPSMHREESIYSLRGVYRLKADFVLIAPFTAFNLFCYLYLHVGLAGRSSSMDDHLVRLSLRFPSGAAVHLNENSHSRGESARSEESSAFEYSGAPTPLSLCLHKYFRQTRPWRAPLAKSRGTLCSFDSSSAAGQS